MNLTQLMTTQAHVVNNHFMAQANQGDRPHQTGSTPVSRIRYFIGSNPPTFQGTKRDDYPQGVIDEVFIVVDVMDVTPREKAEFVAY